MDKLVESKKEQILQTAQKHGAYNVRVFGSAARGDSTNCSDIDFLVDVAPKHSAFFPAGLLLDLQKLLGKQVDILTKDSIHWYIRDRILKEAVPL